MLSTGTQGKPLLSVLPVSTALPGGKENMTSLRTCAMTPGRELYRELVTAR